MIKILLGALVGSLLTVLIEGFMFWVLIVRGKK